MPMSETDAATCADNLLVQLIQHQSQLFTPHGANETVGRTMGDAIAALRLRLIEMYKTQP